MALADALGLERSEKEKLGRLLGWGLHESSIMGLTSSRKEAKLEAESMRSSQGTGFQVIYNTWKPDRLIHNREDQAKATEKNSGYVGI